MAFIPVWLGLCLAVVAGCTSGPDTPESAPTTSPYRAIEVIPDDRSVDVRTAGVIAGSGDAAAVTSHAFNDGVVQVGVRADRLTTDSRLRLCDMLIDEFRDDGTVRQILVTGEPDPLVHWNAPDPQCVADPG
ncbi:hypothetical protein AB0J83_07875 [Actinoplanes sp. NPDC049596]|uniref:hypothetical protein n=1 Tax=unclassified Actinoplanes TaxID=2626549 RepID=UPI0034275D37